MFRDTVCDQSHSDCLRGLLVVEIGGSKAMSLESIICRKNLDEEKGNPWICACPICREARGKDEPNETQTPVSLNIDGGEGGGPPSPDDPESYSKGQFPGGISNQGEGNIEIRSKEG